MIRTPYIVILQIVYIAHKSLPKVRESASVQAIGALAFRP